MRKLISIFPIYLKIILGQKLLIAAMIVFPVFFGSICSYVTKRDDSQILKTALVDNDNSSMSKDIGKKLKNHDSMNVAFSTEEKAKNLLENGRIEAVFVIHKGFEHNVKNGITKDLFDIIISPASFSGNYLSEILAGDVSMISSKYKAKNLVFKKYKDMGLGTEGLEEKVEDYFESTVNPKPLIQVDYSVINIKDTKDPAQREIKSSILPKNKSSIWGSLFMFIMFFLMFGSNWVVEGKSNGTHKRLFSITGGYRNSFVATFLCLCFAGIFLAAIFAAVGNIISGLKIIKGGYEIFVLLAFILNCASITMLFSALFRSPMQLQAFIPVFVFITSFIGGCLWDISLLSGIFDRISMFTPQGLALKALYYISVGLNSSEWIYYTLILAALSIIFLILSYSTFSHIDAE